MSDTATVVTWWETRLYREVDGSPRPELVGYTRRRVADHQWEAVLVGVAMQHVPPTFADRDAAEAWLTDQVETGETP